MNAMSQDETWFLSNDEFSGLVFPKRFCGSQQARNIERKVAWALKVDVSKSQTEFTVMCRLPAVHKDDVEVVLDGRALTIVATEHVP